MYFKALAQPAAPICALSMQALKADAEYELTTYLPAQRTSMDFGGETRQTLVGQRFYGDELMYSGLSVEKIDTDFAGFLWVFERQD